MTVKIDPIPNITSQIPFDEIVEVTDNEVRTTPQVLSWLNIEIMLYSLIIILALAARLWILAYYPLSSHEVNQSFVAFQLYHGEIPTATHYSPLLASLNLLSFFFFGDSDSTARLANVILGMVLVILPWFLRRQLGVKTCLSATMIFAFAPTFLFLSRQVNGEMGVAVGALMVIIALLNWAVERTRRWLWFLAVGAAILLTASPNSLSILLIFALLTLIGWQFLFKSRHNTLEWAYSLTNAAPFNSIFEEFEEEEMPFEASELPLYPADWRQAGILFAILVAVIATAATLNLSGFGVLTSFPLMWLNEFRPSDGLTSGFNALMLLAFYEPLVLIFGFIGLTIAMLRSHLLGLALGGWFVGLLLIDVLMQSRPDNIVILPLIPLTLLAAAVLGWLWSELSNHATLQDEGLLFFISMITLSYGYVGLTGWIIQVCNADDPMCQYLWLKPVAALLLVISITFFFAFMNHRAAWRGLALTIATLTMLLSFNAGTRLNYGPLMDLGYQPLITAPPSTELVDLIDTITEQSERRAKGNNMLDVLVVGAIDPTIRWQLRNFRNVSGTSAVAETPTTSAIITSVNPEEAKPSPVGAEYLGQSFEVNAIWSPANSSYQNLASWFIYRRAKERPLSHQVVLWLRHVN